MTDSQVVIVMARCSKTKGSFGIRTERVSPGEWTCTWAFPCSEKAAKSEGYDRTEIQGRFSALPTYPGCPSCEALGFFKCGCNRVGCWDMKRETVTCPWCGQTGTLTGEIDRLDAGSDA